MCSLKQEDTYRASADPHRHPRLHRMALHGVGQKTAAAVCWVKAEKGGVKSAIGAEDYAPFECHLSNINSKITLLGLLRRQLKSTEPQTHSCVTVLVASLLSWPWK